MLPFNRNVHLAHRNPAWNAMSPVRQYVNRSPSRQGDSRTNYVLPKSARGCVEALGLEPTRRPAYSDDAGPCPTQGETANFPHGWTKLSVERTLTVQRSPFRFRDELGTLVENLLE